MSRLSFNLLIISYFLVTSCMPFEEQITIVDQDSVADPSVKQSEPSFANSVWSSTLKPTISSPNPPLAPLTNSDFWDSILKINFSPNDGQLRPDDVQIVSDGNSGDYILEGQIAWQQGLIVSSEDGRFILQTFVLSDD